MRNVQLPDVDLTRACQSIGRRIGTSIDVDVPYHFTTFAQFTKRKTSLKSFDGEPESF